MLSVAVTLGLAGFALYTSGGTAAPAELEASLGAAAVLDDAPPASPGGYDFTAHQTLSRVILLIKENYVDPSRIQPYEMFLAALESIQRTAAEVIVDDSEAPQRVAISVGTTRRVFDLERLGGLDQLWEVTLALRDIFRFIQSEIPDAEQQRDIEYAAINGMLSWLDPHSVLLPPQSYDEMKLTTKGEFGGLGIVISIRDGALTVISPIEGTPASRAGIKAKDQITKIGEDSTVNMSLEDAVRRLRGKPGSRVNIWVLRQGWTEGRRFALTRAVIKVESVASEMLAGNIGYLRIKSFQANTFDDLHTHIERLRRKSQGRLEGVVLDLRNNPGGLLDQAILVSDRFIEEGPIVITVGEGNRKRDVKSAHAAGTDTDYPMVVLVNGGSASASEIVAGALKNNDRALVLGQQTFGKGSVQVLYDFKDRSALKLTIAQYLTPGELSIQSVGITPDIEIFPGTIGKDGVRLFVVDASPREQDLDHHLDGPALEAASGEQSEPPSHSQERPTSRLVHVVAEDAEEEEAEEAANPDKFTYDFEIELAHDLLVNAGSLSRKQMLQGATELVSARSDEQEAVIVERLAALGADWSKGPDEGAPRAEVTLSFKGLGKQLAVAGSTVTLAASVRNTGTAPLYRVYGVTESENSLFAKLELVFGKIMPGQSRSWEVPVKIPQDMMARADAVVLTLGDLHGHVAQNKATVIVTTAEAARPRFAYRWRIDDAAGGNGDGVLQAGENVELEVAVTNVGGGVAEDTVISVKDVTEQAIFLEQGRDKLGKLAAGGSGQGTLAFSVRNPAEEEVELRLSIWDVGMGEGLSDTLRVPVGPTRKAKPERRGLRVLAKEGAPVFAGAADSAALLGRARPGAVLKGEAAFGNRWWRVSLGAGKVGFVRTQDVKLQPGAGRKATASGVELSSPSTAPVLALDLPSLVTVEPQLKLKGNITDERRLRDLYVFVNDRKVLYRSLADLQLADGAVSSTLDVDLPLEIGSNHVTVVVRESEHLMTRRVFGVYRDDVDAVADRGARGRGE